MSEGTRLDGTGQPFITLAQFLKRRNLVSTGGMAKQAVRELGARVNGEDERRPGRKLHEGDEVEFEGQKHRVALD